MSCELRFTAWRARRSPVRRVASRSVLGACAAACLWSVPAGALDPAKAITQLVLDAWTIDHGLPQNSVQAIHQSRNGYLWLATQEGVARFDGVRFKVFDQSNVAALRSNFFSSLAEDTAGNLWAGSNAGLVRFSADGEVTTVAADVEGGRGNAAVLALAAGADGSLWFGTRGGGLRRYRDGELAVFTTADGLPHDTVQGLAATPDGGLWIGTRQGLCRFDGARFTTLTAADGLAGVNIRALYAARDGTLWIGSIAGLTRLRGGRLQHFGVADGLAHEQVFALAEDADGNLWVATNGGLSRFTGERFTGEQLTSVRRGDLPSDALRSLFVDREGSLWIGTFDAGLLRLKDGRFTTWGQREGLAHDTVMTVLEDHRGSLWIGTFGGGLSRLHDGRFTTFATADGLASDIVWSLAEGPPGTLWIGTYGDGLTRYRDGRFTTWTAADGLAHDSVKALLVDRAGALWIGTAQGLNRLERADGELRAGGLTRFGKGDGLASESITYLHGDRAGNLWIATLDGGVSRYDGRTFTTFTAADGLSSNTVYAVHEDDRGALWLATQDGGLSRFADGRFTAFTSRQGELPDTAHQVLEDDLGHLWLAGNKGVFRVARRDLEAFARGELASLVTEVFGADDGLRSRETIGGSQPAGWKGRDGRLWFPTVDGLSAVDPHRLAPQSGPPPVVIEELRVDQQSVALTPGLRIPAGSERFEIQYTALGFLSPAKLRFRYRLEGYESAWVEAGGRRSVYYPKLPPGDYRFTVSACDPYGRWSPEGASFAFTLAPLFYQTPLFHALLALAVALALILVHRLRIRHLKHRERELGKRVEESLTQIKVLRGMLPICAACKSIRDDHGYWNQLETYLREHSEAELSHSVCPSCADKLFPRGADGAAASQRSEG